MSAGGWYSLACVYTGSAINVYVNGVYKETAGRSGLSNFNSSLYIGTPADNPGNTVYTLNGLIDDVRIYNRALSAAELARLAAGNEPGTSANTVTLVGTLAVNGALSLNSGTLVTGGNAVNVAGSWLNNGGVFTHANNTVTFNGAAASEVLGGGSPFYNIAQSTTLTMDDTVTVAGTWTTNSNAVTASRGLNIPGTLTAGASSMLVANDLTLGTFTAGTSTVTFNGTLDQSVTSNGQTYYKMSVSNTGGPVHKVSFTDNFTLNSFKDTTANSALRFNPGGVYSITGSFSVSGGALGNEISFDTITQAAPNFAFTLASAQIAAYADIAHMNITAGTGAENLTATHSIDGGSNNANSSNNNVIFGAPMTTTLYWTGSASTAWNNGANWASVSGGAGVSAYPVTGYTAIFDGNSHQECVLSADTTLTTITLQTSFAYTLDGNGKTLTLNGPLAHSGTTFRLQNTSLILNSGTSTLNSDWTFNRITVSAPATVVTNGHNINDTGDLTAAGTLDASTGASLIKVTGSMNLTGGSFTPGNSSVILRGTGALTPDTNSFNNLYINDGLIGYWKLDETNPQGFVQGVTDSSGYGNTGTWYGSPTVAATRPALGFSDPAALTFNGTVAEVTLGTATMNGFPLGSSGDFTWSFWVNIAANSATPFLINDVWAVPGYGFWTSGDGKVKVDLKTQIASVTLTSPSALTLGSWYHVAATAQRPGNLILYINGSSVGTQSTAAIAGIDVSPFSLLTIGGNASIGYLNGSMDEVRVYNRALSSADIARLAAGLEPSTSVKTVTLGGPLTANGALTLNGGTLATGGNPVTVAGSWMNNGGVLTPGASTVTINGGSTGGVVQSGGQAFYNLTFNTSGSWTLNDDTTVNTAGTGLTLSGGTLTQTTNLPAVRITGPMTVSGGTYTGTARTLDVTGNLTISSGTFTAPSGMLKVGGGFSSTGGTFAANNGTVVLKGGTAQNVTPPPAAQAFNNVVIGDGLVGYWKFDETSGTTVYDYSGHGFNGTASNGPLPSASSAPLNSSDPRSLYFDGVNDRVSLGGIPFDQTFSISVWLYNECSAPRVQTFLMSNETYLTNGFRYGLPGSCTDLNFWTGQSGGTIGVATPLPVGSWKHIVVTYDGTTARIYNDGYRHF